jgi:predicted transposase YbfD/YdcC
VPALLRALELSGCIVTLDAMGCQKEIAKKIQQAAADCMLALKGSQGQCYQETKSCLDDAVAWHNEKAPARRNAVPFGYHETVQKEHGLLEKWRCWCAGTWDGLLAGKTGRAWPAWG